MASDTRSSDILSYQAQKSCFGNRVTKRRFGDRFSTPVSYLTVMTRESMPHVVALCGSLRDESRTKVLLESLLETARKTGATTELVDLRSYELPSLHAVESEPPDADRLRATIDDADSVALGDAQLSRIVCRIAEGRPRLLSSRGVRRNDRRLCSRWPAASFRDRRSHISDRQPDAARVAAADRCCCPERPHDDYRRGDCRRSGRRTGPPARPRPRRVRRRVALSRDGLPRDGDRNGVRGR